MKKYARCCLTGLFGLFALVWLICSPICPAASAAAVSHANLVVVVRFADDTVGDGATGYNAAYLYRSDYTYWQQFRSWFSPTGISYFDDGTISLQSYMSTISNGARAVSSYFPQSSADGKTVSYLTLPQDQSYYESVGDLQLVEDAAAKFAAAYPGIDGSAWGTGGTLDNLELVVQVGSEPGTSDTLLWPHKSSASGACSFGGMAVYEYNLVNSKAVGDLGTVKHEYLHTVGLGDLYRVGDTSAAAGPAGVWDIMGTAAGQWPLAQSLANLGFYRSSDLPAVSGAGIHSITLVPHYSAAGTQAVRVVSPYSDSESFVFEYRQKDTSSLAPDRMVPSSGLIVYRVNDAVDTDSNGHRTNRIHDSGYYEDAIYIFRPGETGLHDSDGELNKAALSTAGYAYLGDAANTRTSFGSTDLALAAFAEDENGKSTFSNTIFDSQGRNSGLTVTVTAQTDSSITFDLTIPDYSSLDLWDAAGGAVTGAEKDTIDELSLAADSDGRIIQSYLITDGDTATQSIRVRRWDGSVWTDLGTAAEGLLGHAQVQAVGTQLFCTYAAFPGSDNAAVVKKWTGSSWQTVTSVSTGSAYANALTSAVIGGSLYLLIDRDNTDIQVYRLDDSALTAVGGTLPIGYITGGPQLTSLNGRPAVVCGDVGSGFTLTTGENVWLYSGNSWQKIYSEEANVARNPACAPYGSSLITFVGYDSGITPKIVLFDSSGTATSHAFTAAGTNIQDASLLVSGDLVYLTVVDGNGLCTTWYSKADSLTNWSKLGADVDSNASVSGGGMTAADDARIYTGVVNINKECTVVSLLSHGLVGTDLSGASVTAETLTCTGSTQTPSVTVTLLGEVLTPGTDYSVTGSAADAGSHTAFINGKGRYFGTVRFSYTISPKVINFAVTAPTAKTYTGSALTFLPTVKDGSRLLTAGTDYAVGGNVQTNAGTYTMTVTGKGNYAGSTGSAKYTISPKVISFAVTAPAAKTYTCSALTFMPTVKDGSRLLTAGTDYIVSGSVQTNAGTYTLTVTGKGNYAGSTGSAKYTISPKVINFAVPAPAAKTYTGSALTFMPTVKDGSRLLTAGTDYTVSGKVQTSAGAYTLTVTGKGNYAGSTGSAKYTISPKVINFAVTAPAAKTYTGSALTFMPTVKDGRLLTAGTDYTVGGNVQTNAGTYTLTVTGKGNYAGSTGSAKYTITLRNILLTLDANGGRVFPATMDTVLGSVYGRLPAPARTGYIFIGWYTSASGGTQITSSSVVSVASDHTLYAHWAYSSGVQGFVTRLYDVCLGRDPDAAGLDDWTGQLNSRTNTGAGVACGFIFSSEFKAKDLCNTDYVKYLYRAFLGREYDSAGLADWVGRLENGWTREAVFNGFVGSDEFTGICNTYGITRGDGCAIPQYGTVPTGSCSVCGKTDGVTAFVTRLYSVCLDRNPDAHGLADWTNQLWSHTNTGAGVAFGFIFSPEYQAKNASNAGYVTRLYKAFFDRDPDALGYADWLGRLNGGASRQDIFYGFVGSDEFTNLCNKYGIARG